MLHGNSSFFGLKCHVLFVYYDVPFYACQDKLISFAAVAYICLLVNAARHAVAVPAALVALGVTVLGLDAVNVSDALQSVLVDKGTGLYWAQTVAIAAYEVWLVALYHKQK